MFALESQEPRWIELIPARGEAPPVAVLFPAVPSAKALRKAIEAMRAVMVLGGPDAMIDGGDAFSREMVRWSILDWSGIVNESGEVISPTHDQVIERDEGDPEVISGTITAFLAEPRLMQAADKKFVIPWTRRDAEKNGFSPSLAGTSARATQAGDTATLPVPRRKRAGAKSASTKSRLRKPTSAKSSGK